MRVESTNATGTRTEEIIANVTYGETADEALVVEAVLGSNDAFGVLFERYENKMFHVAVRVLRNREDAEDAVQQAFTQAFVHLQSFQGQSRFSTWLTRIAINEALMLLRKRRPCNVSLEGNTTAEKEDIPLEIEDRTATPEKQCEEQELHGILSEAIRELKPILRKVVQLHDLVELSTGETAEALGLSDGTVKARTFRARRLLRRKLAQRLGFGGGEASGPVLFESRAGYGTARQAGSLIRTI